MTDSPTHGFVGGELNRLAAIDHAAQEFTTAEEAFMKGLVVWEVYHEASNRLRAVLGIPKEP